MMRKQRSIKDVMESVLNRLRSPETEIVPAEGFVMESEPIVVPDTIEPELQPVGPKPVAKARPAKKPKPVKKEAPLTGESLARAKTRLAEKFDTSWESR